MGIEKQEVNVPEAPKFLPEGLQKKWQANYRSAYLESAGDNSVSEMERVQAALKEANRVLRVPAPESYSDARALEDWQVVSRVEANGELRGVTIDGKKFRFAVPGKTAAPAKADKGQN